MKRNRFSPYCRITPPGFFLFSFFITAFLSCDILRDSSYEVTAWSPGGGFHADPGSIVVSINLSHESDRARTEQAFSMVEDNKTLKGYFSWEGSRFIFRPASPLQSGRNYTITLGTGAQDTEGVSLENKFEGSFTTLRPGGKIKITGSEPGGKGIIDGSRGVFRLFFSEPAEINSCIDFISFTPAIQGSWVLENEGRAAAFTPREPWQTGSLYRIKADALLQGVSGSQMGTEYTSSFYAGEDREKPVLLKALALDPSGAVLAEIPPGTNLPSRAFSGWEADTVLEFVFSEDVDCAALKSLLSAEPSTALVMASPPEISSRALFRFAEYPEWGSSFLFRLGPGVKDRSGNESEEEFVFRITAGGRLSKPPALAGIRLPMAPGASAADGENGPYKALSFTPEDIFGDLPVKPGEKQYPFMEPIPAWIELYFETAPETEIDPVSVMDLFRVDTTNLALSFSPRSIHSGDFHWVNPREGWEHFTRLEVRGFLTNMVGTGLVTFRIAPGLKDMRGNKSSRDFRISLLK